MRRQLGPGSSSQATLALPAAIARPHEVVTDMSATTGGAEVPRSAVVVQGVCLSVMVSAICAFLGDPCGQTTGVAVLDHLPVFRFTCIGFATFAVLGLALPWRTSADRCSRVAILFNSLAFWWVTFAWCMDRYSWWCIFVLEHLFIVLSVTMILGGKGLIAHVAFTTAGAFTSFAAPSLDEVYSFDIYIYIL